MADRFRDLEEDVGSDDDWAPESSDARETDVPPQRGSAQACVRHAQAPAKAATSQADVEAEIEAALFAMPREQGLLSSEDGAKAAELKEQQAAQRALQAQSKAESGRKVRFTATGSGAAPEEGAGVTRRAGELLGLDGGKGSSSSSSVGEEGGAPGGGGGGGGAHKGSRRRDNDDLASLERSVGSRIKLGLVERASERAPRHTGRDDRATVDLVLDPRTRLIIFRLVSQGLVGEVYGCVSAGKEANVYFAEKGALADVHESVMADDGSRAAAIGGTGPAADAAAAAAAAAAAGPDMDAVGASAGTVAPNGFALKVFKTSILVFKDRDRYVSGEYRFRSGYSRKNPRKMVKMWAEKEIRNLRRLRASGIHCPTPRLLRGHVLLMDFIGTDGWPAPRLRDAKLSPSKQASAYEQVVHAMRAMWERCRLVHADLSEYNLLWHEGRVVVIDVSQSVESDHPRAMDFLRMDCANVTYYFGRRCGLRVMTPRELFDFVVHPALPDKAAEDAYLAAVWSEVRSRQGGEVFTSAEDEAEHNVFMQAFIPRSLADVDDAEAEADRVERGEAAFTQALVAPERPAEGAEAEAAEAGAASAAPGSTASAAGTAAADALAAASAAAASAAAGSRQEEAASQEADTADAGAVESGEAGADADSCGGDDDDQKDGASAAGGEEDGNDEDDDEDDDDTAAAGASAGDARSVAESKSSEATGPTLDDLLADGPSAELVAAALEAANMIGLDTTFVPGFGALSIENHRLEYTANSRRILSEQREAEAAEDAARLAGDAPARKHDDGAFKLRDATKEERRAHKAAVKAAARQQRVTKVKKSAKRRRENTGARASK